MGSQIRIDLQSVLNNPTVEVRMFSEDLGDDHNHSDSTSGMNLIVHYAEVTFKQQSRHARPFVFNFSYHVYSGQVELSADFNWFRYDEDTPQRKLMRALYENGVDFKVSH